MHHFWSASNNFHLSSVPQKSLNQKGASHLQFLIIELIENLRIQYPPASNKALSSVTVTSVRPLS